jgi:ankyrin repeat protein
MEHMPDEILLNVTSNMDMTTLREYAQSGKKYYNVVITEMRDRFRKYGIPAPEDYGTMMKQLKFLEDLENAGIQLDLQVHTMPWLWARRPTIKAILDRGVDHRTRGHRGGSTLLLDAAHQQDEQMMHFLLDLGANPNEVTGNDGYHIFTFLEGHPNLIALALYYGGDPTMIDDDAGISLQDILQGDPALAADVLTELTDDPTYFNNAWSAAQNVLQWYRDN